MRLNIKASYPDLRVVCLGNDQWPVKKATNGAYGIPKRQPEGRPSFCYYSLTIHTV